MLQASRISGECDTSASPMDQDTDMGGLGQRFPTTKHSAIIAARSDDREVRQRAFGIIVESYWKPAYKYIRIKWQAANEDAKDLTQSFFAIAIEKDYFASYDPAKASFQTFIRTCLDRFVANQRKSEQRLKRGGGADHFSLDFSEAENELSLQDRVSKITPEDYFYREWVRSLFGLTVEALRLHYAEKETSVYFSLFELYDLREDDSMPPVSYKSLARQFDLRTADVTNYLAAARREFRRLVLARLREMTATDEEFQTEARSLLGVEIE
jgi:DNA-directed RNA polymerase specialized sigma24 family protein